MISNGGWGIDQLVLSRRIGETLFIDLSDAVAPSTPVGELFADGQVEVAVLDVNGSQVKVGVEAPEVLVSEYDVG